MNRKYFLDEIWLPIKGYRGLYEISNYGRVKCLDYRKTGEPEILHLHARKGHYLMVGLRTGTKFRYFRVHRLVAQTFLPLPKEGQCHVIHLDGNKQNNYVKCEFHNGMLLVYADGTNLRWTEPIGKKASEETRYRLSLSHSFPSEETRRRMSEGQKRRYERERKTHTGRYSAWV